MDNWKKRFKQTMMIRVFAFRNIPLLWWINPSILVNSRTQTTVKIPLSWKTKNHLKSMYFGALAMGAEAAIAIRAFQEIVHSKRKIDFIFKDFNATFLKRAEGDVLFTCDQGEDVRKLLEKAILTGQRESQTFQSYAIVPSKSPNEKVAEFSVTLSVKLRN